MTVLDFYRFLRHNFVPLILLTMAGLFLAAAYAYLQPVVYKSTATGIVVAGDNTTVGGAMSGSSLAKQRASTYASLINTSAVRQRVMAQPEIQANPEAGRGTLDAEVTSDTIIQVSATGSSGENARLLADAALTALAEEAVALESLTPNEAGAPVTPEQIAVRLAKYSSAYATSTPISPNWTQILLTGAGLGLLAGLAIAFLRRSLDTRVRTMRDAETETGHGVLGVIPDSKEFSKQREGSRVSLSALGTTGEALRQLRTNLRFVDVDNPPRTIVVSSANPGEGKSTISSVLAVLIARSGMPTVLIDADLRKPVQHKTFNADAAVGLSQVLVGDIVIEDALQPTNEPNLFLLTAGRVPSNPSEMVGSRRMKSLLSTLSESYFVVVDAPPVLAVTDAPLLSASTDGVVLVTRVGRTQKEQLRLATKLIEQVGGTILGTVLHRARPNALGDAVYGAGYGGKYQSYYGQGYLAGKAEDPMPITAQPQTAVFEVDPADAALTTEVNETRTRAARRRA